MLKHRNQIENGSRVTVHTELGDEVGTVISCTASEPVRYTVRFDDRTQSTWNESQVSEAAPSFRHYGYRAARDVTPGVDYLEHEHAGRTFYAKVLEATGVELLSGDAGVRFTLELPSGRTFVLSMSVYRHVNVYYRSR